MASSISSPAWARRGQLDCEPSRYRQGRVHRFDRSRQAHPQASAGNLKRVSLELGGKSPNVIFPDADMEQAVRTAAIGVFAIRDRSVARQRASSCRKNLRRVRRRISPRPTQIKPGHPLNPDTPPWARWFRASSSIASRTTSSRQEEGAQAKAGGERGPQAKGYFVKPTIFHRRQNNMRIAREEIFGPVAVLIPFKDENDAILQGNDTTYGLGAAVWTRDISRAHQGRTRAQGGIGVGELLRRSSIQSRPLAATSSRASVASWAGTRSTSTRRSNRFT